MDFGPFKFLGEQLFFLHGQDFFQKLEIFAIAWVFVRLTFSGHMKRIEKALFCLSGEVSLLRKAVTNLEVTIPQRIDSVEENVNALGARVLKLENK
jgi:hypothetical protein